MRVYGKAALSDVLGDRVVYRNLKPCQANLPNLDELRQALGIPAGETPRKNEMAYGQVGAAVLQAARRQDDPHCPIRRLAFIGDTRLLDSTAFGNLAAAGGWPGAAFICSEDSRPEQTTIEQPTPSTHLFLANRWALLAAFDAWCSENGLPIDDSTAVVIDLDKTFLGARGRNGQVIDNARVAAVQETLAGILGQGFDAERFRAIYDPLNQPEFHPFTTDNQDYLAYVCLVIGSGFVRYDDVVARFRSGAVPSFEAFIVQVEQGKTALPPALQGIHADIYARVQQGDPTPFKAFRRNEYRCTVARYGCLPDDAPVEDMLTQEITITEEVFAWAQTFRRRGALLFGLSDKPDEAALPTHELAAKGCLPLHRTLTHRVGK